MTDLPVLDPFDDRLITDGCCKEERTSSDESVGDEINQNSQVELSGDISVGCNRNI